MKKILQNPSIWIIVFLLLLGVFVFFFVSTFGEKMEGYLLLSNISSFSCNKEYQCKIITPEDIINDKNKSSFLLYQKNTFVGEYNADYVSKWNFFDLNGEWYNVQDNFIASSKNMDLKIKEFTLRKMNSNELDEVNRILKEKKINNYANLVQNEVLEYDFNKDGNLDKIILVSNASDESNDEKFFMGVIGMVNNKYEILHLDVFNYFYEVPAYNIKNIINIFNEKEDILVLTKGYYSEEGLPSSEIYQVKRKFISITSD